MATLKIPADYYDQSIKTNLLQRLYHLTRFRQILEFVGEIEGDFLDVGCASGLLTQQIASQSKAKAWGVDVNPDFINYAQKKYPQLHFLVAQAENLPFPPEKFSFVLCAEVLEHVSHPQKVLRECRRVLKDGGRILVVVPSESWLFRFLWFFWTKMKGKVWQKTHLNHFKARELEKLLKKLGFKILRLRTFQLGMLRIVEGKKV